MEIDNPETAEIPWTFFSDFSVDFGATRQETVSGNTEKKLLQESLLKSTWRHLLIGTLLKTLLHGTMYPIQARAVLFCCREVIQYNEFSQRLLTHNIILTLKFTLIPNDMVTPNKMLFYKTYVFSHRVLCIVTACIMYSHSMCYIFSHCVLCILTACIMYSHCVYYVYSHTVYCVFSHRVLCILTACIMYSHTVYYVFSQRVLCIFTPCIMYSHSV